MPRRFVVEMTLNRLQLADFEDRATAEPPPTVDALHAWIGGLGYSVNRSAVYSWFRHVRNRQRPADTTLVLSTLRLIVLNQREFLQRSAVGPMPKPLEELNLSVLAALDRGRRGG